MCPNLIDLVITRVVAILCGGNIDTNLFGRCLERGLIAVGRLLRFSVVISDKPGSLSALCAVTSAAGGSIIEVVQERKFMPDIHNIEVRKRCGSAEYPRLILTEKFSRLIFAPDKSHL